MPRTVSQARINAASDQHAAQLRDRIDVLLLIAADGHAGALQAIREAVAAGVLPWDTCPEELLDDVLKASAWTSVALARSFLTLPPPAEEAP